MAYDSIYTFYYEAVKDRAWQMAFATLVLGLYPAMSAAMTQCDIYYNLQSKASYGLIFFMSFTYLLNKRLVTWMRRINGGAGIEVVMMALFLLAVGSASVLTAAFSCNKFGSTMMSFMWLLPTLALLFFSMKFESDLAPHEALDLYSKHEYVKAAAGFKKSAIAGHYMGQYMYAVCNLSGRGVEKNIPVGMEYLEKAADQGHSLALYAMGNQYLVGQHVPKDIPRALAYLTRAADENHHAESAYLLGRLYSDDDTPGITKDMTIAYKMFGIAAESGHRESKYMLGLCLQAGLGVDKDEKRAFEIYKALPEHVGAMYMLSRAYLNGTGCDKNLDEAFRLFTILSEKHKHLDADYQIAMMHIQGYGTSKNVVHGAELMLKAAEAGSVAAMYSMGALYTTGMGVKIDEKKAKIWFDKANAAKQSPDVEEIEH